MLVGHKWPLVSHSDTRSVLILDNDPSICHRSGEAHTGQNKFCICRERNDGLLRPITYLFFKIFGEVAVLVFASLGASLLVFYTVRLAGSFVFFWIAYLLTAMNGIGAILGLKSC